MKMEYAINLMSNIINEKKIETSDLRTIAELCGKLPLALRASASYIQVHKTPLREYIELLEQAQKEQAKLNYVSRAGFFDKDLDVYAVLCLSLDRLIEENENLAILYTDLANFPADFDARAASAVWELSFEQTRVYLDQLIARSLLERDFQSGRFKLHDLLQELALNYMIH